ncbi:uncharacterized protein F5Z01DRAFT_427055 [Emericellopsis atlantica]|uniref:Zn(2)-C6 fungal-type domain-containing protein n=1 Tax=Emericellopsis atlantica TaxID=2614577 RepID=A0A9P7ZEI4_9HYPO|nr:uncharacterized protein F5Z01DRAFT_427055 [Emericellopsis atlantica]KAG9250085.1 hypothetical protein F5Z01DRAFT_427055 [Emericellopsis atlantica]
MVSGLLVTPPEDFTSDTHNKRNSILGSHHNKTTPSKIAHRHARQREAPANPILKREPARANPSMDGRHKRVWKACERCRMKKTKCDGEFPCKRCKDDGLICTAGIRKKTEYKQLPKGYAEVLEHTQFALVQTVHKLYQMVREGQTWTLDEPTLNDRNLPVIHDIADKLGCIRPHSDIDLPISHIFPEDERGLTELQAKLEAAEAESATRELQVSSNSSTSNAAAPHPVPLQHQQSSRSSGSHNQEGAISSPSAAGISSGPGSVSDTSDLDMDYRATAFGGSGGSFVDSPPSYAASHNDFNPRVLPQPPRINSAPSFLPAGQQQQLKGRVSYSGPQVMSRQVSTAQTAPQQRPFTKQEPQQRQQQFDATMNDYTQHQSNMAFLANDGSNDDGFLINPHMVGPAFFDEGLQVMGDGTMGDPMLWNGVLGSSEFDESLI